MYVGDVGLLDWKESKDFLAERLKDPNCLHVGHHIAYDMAVMAAEHPELLPLIFNAYRESRVTDTMIRQMLLDNAIGKFGGYWTEYKNAKGDIDEKYIKIYYSLDACYHRVTKKRLKKGTVQLRYGELRDVPME